MGNSVDVGDEVLEQDVSNIKLIRTIDRTIHVSSIDRKKEVDYVVENTSDKEYNYLFLPLEEFERNLKVYDEDGTLLNIFPNSKVKRWLEEIRKDDESKYEQIQHRFKHADYKLYIQLPPDKPLKSGDLRTIRLTFEESDPVKFYGFRTKPYILGLITNWKRKYFKIPSFVAEVERFPGHEHDEFIVVVGPPGYSAIGESNLNGDVPSDKVHTNGLEDDARVFSIRLPPAEDHRYDGNIFYDLVPHNTRLMLGLYLYWKIVIIIGLVTIGLALFNTYSMDPEIGQTVSAGFVTATVGLIFALKSDWADRYRILCIIPLLVHGISWILWSFVQA